MNTQFADRLGNITVASGVVRLEFLTVKELHTEDKKAELETSLRLAMPLDGIMQTIEALEKMKAELIEKAQQANAEQANVEQVNT